MLHDPDPLSARAAYRDASDAFLATLAAVPPDAWECPGLGAWTVRELTGHALRAFSTLQRLFDNPGGPVVVDSTAAYYRAVGELTDIHAAVLERGREAGAQLTEPERMAGRIASETLARLDRTADGHVGETTVGPMRLADYLPTRVVELGIHTLDLQRATGQPMSLPASTTAVILAVVVPLADVPELLMAMTGREPLPDGYNVLG